VKILFLGGVLLATFGTFGISNTQHTQASKYAGQETREIKSLSPDDIAELRRGGGWGLAKSAELNGMPGPAHLLELKDKIPLKPEQVSDIQKIFDEMKANAIREGEHLIELEKQLESRFRDRTISDQELRRLLDGISKSRRDLRYIHLSAHLSTPALLTKDQITRYNQLRGYGDNPCASVPEGHDSTMWRKHNSCE